MQCIRDFGAAALSVQLRCSVLDVLDTDSSVVDRDYFLLVESCVTQAPVPKLVLVTRRWPSFPLFPLPVKRAGFFFRATAFVRFDSSLASSLTTAVSIARAVAFLDSFERNDGILGFAGLGFNGACWLCVRCVWQCCVVCS